MKRMLAVDLDQTLIYSYKKDLGEDKVLVESLKGKELSYMTRYAYERLCSLMNGLLFIPITTRSLEQYRRIVWAPSCKPSIALAANGGVMLVDGEENTKWKEESFHLIEESREELTLAEKILEEDAKRSLDVRRVEGLFLFTKSDSVTETLDRLKTYLHPKTVGVFENGSKVYVVPRKLHKGMALERLKMRYPVDEIIAAGDSKFDVEMLETADVAVCPESLRGVLKQEHVIYAGQEEILSDVLMHYLDQKLQLVDAEEGR